MSVAILNCIYAAIDEANLDRDGRPQLLKAESTEIFGTPDGLDSLGLINFVVAVEENVEREVGVAVSLSDDRTLAREPSPLATVGSLAAHLEELLADAGVRPGAGSDSPAR